MKKLLNKIKLPKKPKFINKKSVLITLALTLSLGLISTGIYFGMLRSVAEPWSEVEVVAYQSRMLTNELLANASLLIEPEEGETTAEESREVLQQIATQRQEYMVDLMQVSPKDFLLNVIAPEIREEQFDGIDGIEEKVTIEGTVEMIMATPPEDNDLQGFSTSISLITSNNERYQVRLVEEEIADEIASDYRIRVTGYVLSNNIVADTLSNTENFMITAAASNNLEISNEDYEIMAHGNVAAPTAATPTIAAASSAPQVPKQERRVAVIRVNFSQGNLPSRYNNTWIQDRMDTLNNRLRRTTHNTQELRLPVTTRNVTISRGSTCNYHIWRDRAIAEAGINRNNFSHIIILLPHAATAGLPAHASGMWACNQFAALGQVATPQTMGAVTWYRMRGDSVSAWYNFLFLHEIGHNLGFRHAVAARCTNASGNVVRVSNTCIYGGNSHTVASQTPSIWANTRTLEYGDGFDTMGHGGSAVGFNAHFRDIANFNRPANVQNVTTNGTFRIYPRGNNNNVQLLRVPTSVNGVIRNYFLEYHVGEGVAVRTFLNRDTRAFGLPLRNGQVHNDSGRVRFEVTGANSTRATVQISNLQPHCVRNAPAVTLTQTSQTIASTTWRMAITNRNSAGCPNVTYSIARNVSFLPNANQTLSLASGASGHRDFTITHNPATVSNGNFPVTFTVTAPNTTTVTRNATYRVANSTVAVCRRGIPVISASPTSRNGNPGTAQEYVITVRNTDSNTCAARAFILSADLRSAAGFTINRNNASVRLAPGASITETFRITSPATAPLNQTFTIPFALRDGVTQVATIPVRYVVTQPAPPVDPCRRNAPTLSMTPSTQSGAVGTARTYTVTIRNNNVGCPITRFDLNANIPRGFTTNRTNATLNIASGATASVAFAITPTNTVTPGVHGITVNIRESITNLNRAVGATYNVPPPPAPPAQLIVNRSGINNGERITGNGTRAFRVTASHPDGIESINIYLNNTRVQTCTARTDCTYTINLGRLNAGNYSIKTSVRANLGNRPAGHAARGAWTTNFVKVDPPPANPLIIIGHGIRITLR